MPEFTTEWRQFRGATKYAGFEPGKMYLLRYLLQEDGLVSIQMDHMLSAVPPLLVPAKRFAQWWVVQSSKWPTGGK